MKIGLITGEFAPMPGGVGDFSRLLAQQMAAQGHRVHILSRHGTRSDSLPLCEVAGWGARAVPQIRAWIRRHQLEIVNLQFQTAAFDMSPLLHFWPRLLPAPLVTTFHDLRHPYLFPKAGPLRDWVLRQLARSSRGVITTNQADDQRLLDLPRKRLIPLGSSIPRLSASAEERSRLRRLAGADANCLLLGHFGFIKAIKGVDFLIEALATLRAEGRDLRLVFIGARSNALDGSDDARFLSAISRRIERAGLDVVVHFTGPLPDTEVAAWLKAVDLVALPFTDGAAYSRSSLVAAIHQSCAILTTQPTVTIEAFAHRRNLWLVERMSAQAIEAAIVELLSDRTQLRRLRCGAGRLSDLFAWDAIASETLAFYATLL